MDMVDTEAGTVDTEAGTVDMEAGAVDMEAGAVDTEVAVTVVVEVTEEGVEEGTTKEAPAGGYRSACRLDSVSINDSGVIRKPA